MAAFVDGAREPKGVSRRSFLKFSVALGGVAAVAGAAGTSRAYANEVSSAASYPVKPVKFAVMSDTHYFSPNLWSDCPDYTVTLNSDRKMFNESRAILKKALDDVVANECQLVLIPGDLTKDGELVCHKEVKQLVDDAKSRLKAKGVDCKFLVINGNHDLRNFNGKDFSGGHAADAEHTEPAQLKDLWSDIYGSDDIVFFDKSGNGDGSLSYAAHPFKGLTVIAVDTCKYNETDSEGHTPCQVTEGDISNELLKWVCDQAKQARAAGDLVLAIQHHGIVPHFVGEEGIMWQYLVGPQGAGKYNQVADAYAKAGISAVLTGHMHANDVAAKTVEGLDAPIYDIETGSLVTYPSYMRMGTLAYKADGKDGATVTMTVDVHKLGTIAYTDCGMSGSEDITVHGSTRTLTKLSVQTMICDMAVTPLLGLIPEGKKSLDMIAELLQMGTGAKLLDAAWGALADAIGPEGKDIALGSIAVLHVTYDKAKDEVQGHADLNLSLAADERSVASDLPRIALATEDEQALVDAFRQDAGSARGLASLDLSITGTGFRAFVTTTFDSIDSGVFQGEGRVRVVSVVKQLIGLLLDHKLGDDAEHNVIQLADTAYQAHLLGNEKDFIDGKGWFDAATKAIVPNGLLNTVIGDSINLSVNDKDAQGKPAVGETANVFKTFASGISLDLTKLVTAKVGGLAGLVANKALQDILKKYNNLYLIMGLFGMVEGVKGNNLIEGFIPAIDLGQVVSGLLPTGIIDLAHDTLFNLSHDANVATDHDFSFGSSVENTSGNGNGDGGTVAPLPPDNGSDGNTGNGGSGNDGNAGNNGNGGSGNSNGGQTGNGSNAGNGGNGNGGQTGNGGSGSNGGHAGSGVTSGSGTTAGETAASNLPKTGDPSMFATAAAALAGAGVLAAGAKAGLSHKASDASDSKNDCEL